MGVSERERDYRRGRERGEGGGGERREEMQKLRVEDIHFLFIF